MSGSGPPSLTRVVTDPGLAPLASRLVPVFTVRVPCQDLSRVVSLVAKRLPLASSLAHLKRVRREPGASSALVLLAPCDDDRLVAHAIPAGGGLRPCPAGAAETCEHCCTPGFPELIAGDLTVVSVPAVAASEAAAFSRESAEIWPLARLASAQARAAPLDEATRAYLLAGAAAARALAAVAAVATGKATHAVNACVIASPPQLFESAFSVHAAAAAPAEVVKGKWQPLAGCVMLTVEALAAADRAAQRCTPAPQPTHSQAGLMHTRADVTLPVLPADEVAAETAAAGSKRSRPSWERGQDEEGGGAAAGLRTGAAPSLAVQWCAGAESVLAAATAVFPVPGGGGSQDRVMECAAGSWATLSPRAVLEQPPAALRKASFAPAASSEAEAPCAVSSAASAEAGASPYRMPPAPAQSSFPLRYLATGMDAFLTREPDAFEAMALVHSRVARVIYCEPDARNGALGSASQPLHEVRALNHHYDVYIVDFGAPPVVAPPPTADRADAE